FTREIPDDPISPGIWAPIQDEYAVGLPPDPRNGSGGVALGYGYDEKGTIRPGACNMTLWATGDSLQGTDLSPPPSDNEPLAKSWFVDYAGHGSDPQKQGHLGDIEIWQPCDRGVDSGGSPRSADMPPDYFAPGEAPSEGTYNLRLENRSVPDAC